MFLEEREACGCGRPHWGLELNKIEKGHWASTLLSVSCFFPVYSVSVTSHSPPCLTYGGGLCPPLMGAKINPPSLKSFCQAFLFHSNIKIQNKLMSGYDLRGQWDHIYFGLLWSWFCATGMNAGERKLSCVSALTPYVKSSPVDPFPLGFSFLQILSKMVNLVIFKVLLTTRNISDLIVLLLPRPNNTYCLIFQWKRPLGKLERIKTVAKYKQTPTEVIGLLWLL